MCLLKKIVRFSLLTIILLSFNKVYGQQEFRLALEYYNNREFDKAESVLETLLEKNTNSTYLRYYLNSLVEQKKFDETEKAIKYYSRKVGNNPSIKVDIGQIYKLMGKAKESEKYYREAISSSLNNRNSVVSVASSFINNREFEWAERTYFEASKKLKNETFEQELAMLYYYMRRYGEMVDIYLELLARSDGFLQMVQNRLNSAIYTDTDKSLTDIVEQKLLLKIQQYPNHDVFNEMLIWIYIQQNNYSGAYIQARALDLRNRENGSRLITLAKQATEAKDYETAVKAYNDVLAYGEFSPFYEDAYREKLYVLYARIKTGLDTDIETINNTIELYRNAIAKFGYQRDFLPTILNFIELSSLYSDTYTEALQTIEKAENIRGLTNIDIANIEILKADIMLYQNKIWDATLIYAKIERDNKDNPIGYEAKFRKVKMAFYLHDFEWAKSQIDVIKASTTKLTSNDAIEMSIVLYEGWSETDSTQQPLKLFATALLKHAQHDVQNALILVDSVVATGHSFLSVEALNLKGKILQENARYAEAAEAYERAVTFYSYETNSDFSLFQLGKLYSEHLNDSNKAIELFTRLLHDYKSSIFCIEARHLIHNIRHNPVQ
ncbi:MAG: tetratricopeptide repeat protein [Salinivirgaceae bacterium]|jgi:tetratricopeptide (TPR) repeat protein|nr:tetratricopeptide repeat protein [Bacteroidales bacterium]